MTSFSFLDYNKISNNKTGFQLIFSIIFVFPDYLEKYF